MQSPEGADTVTDLPSDTLSRHISKLSLNGNVSGFSHNAFHSNKPSTGGLRDRLNGGGLPSINTNRDFQGQAMPSAAELQSPATAYDMNFTPLLPSQLLMGSPFQPGSPSTFQSPQFQNFQTFTPMNHAAHLQNQGQQLGGNAQNQQPMSPQYQSIMAPAGLGSAQFYGGAQVPNGFGDFGASYGNTMAMAPGLGSSTSRTVYLGNIPPDTPVEELLGHVRSGQIESVRMLPDRNCAFISFLDGSSAVHFHSDAILKKLSIRGQDVKIGWGKPSHIPSAVALAVQQTGASRNVYLGGLSPDVTEDEIREDLGKFGPIDTVKLVREKNIGFVHFLSISAAIKAVSQLPQEPKWQAPRRVFYGKDRCAYVSKTQQQNAAQYLGIPQGYAHVLNSADRDLISNALAQQSVAAAAVATAAGGANNLGNRTVYLGNIHPETTTEEICNVVRGGLLHHIRFIPDKHICFVTFIDPTAAASFFALSQMQGLMIHNRRLKMGWGKHSQALPPAIALAVSGGASRNVYIGNIDDSWTEERLRQDFSEYGEIELVNTLREKSCAFVNYTNIANAIKAIEQVRGREEYKRFKINFGKDRCGNPPRQIHQTSQNHQDQYQQQTGSYQVMQDGVGSPDANGAPYGSRNSHTPVGSGAPRQNGVDPSYHGQMPNGTGHEASNAYPMQAYLNHISNQQQQQQQHHHQQQHQNYQQQHLQQQQYQQNQSFDHLSPSHTQHHSAVPSISRTMDGPPRQQQQNQPFHGLSNSFSVNPNDLGSGGPTTLGGMLAPNARGTQHSRAISMPTNPENYYNGPQLSMQNGDSGSLGHSLLPNGGGPYGHGHGLAIHGNSMMTPWAEDGQARS